MPRGGGTGPRGRGAATGRGLGPCSGANGVNSRFGFGRGLGLGGRRGLGRGYVTNYDVDQTFSKNEKESLNEQKNLLQKQLEAIEKQLEKL
jgi:hypothetical protein